MTAQPHNAFTARAVKIAKRDGVPEIGSTEFRLHGPLENDHYISTDKVMVSFRTAKGTPIALLEQLWSDDERTHIVDRKAIAVNPLTGQVYNQDLFFQASPGDYSSVVAMGEIELDRNRKQLRHEKTGHVDKMNGHVIAQLHRRSEVCRALVAQFQHAAGMLGVGISKPTLASNRNLFKVHPSNYLAK